MQQPTKTKPIPQKVDKLLQTVFSFFAKRAIQPQSATFEQILESTKCVGLPEFLKCCKFFGVPCHSRKQYETFKHVAEPVISQYASVPGGSAKAEKKRTVAHNTLDFDGFKSALTELYRYAGDQRL